MSSDGNATASTSTVQSDAVADCATVSGDPPALAFSKSASRTAFALDAELDILARHLRGVVGISRHTRDGRARADTEHAMLASVQYDPSIRWTTLVQRVLNEMVHAAHSYCACLRAHLRLLAFFSPLTCSMH